MHKKCSAKKTGTHILLQTFCTILLLALTSCENFLKGGDFKDELEKAIDYSNAKSCTLVISSDSTTGTFLSSGERSCKLGYTVDLQYTVKKEDYVFKGLEAVSSRNTAESRSDCVEFTLLTEESDPDAGFYTISVKLIKDAGDILIRAKCTQLPRVKEVFPAKAPLECDQDTTIKITFTKSINPETFNFSNINFTSGTENLNEYYLEPYFTNENTVLNIPADKTKFILPQDSTQTYKNITLSINFTGTKDTDELEIREFDPYTYRVNKNVDNQPPVITDIHLFSTSSAEDWYYRELTSKSESQWSSEKVENENELLLNGDYSRNFVNRVCIKVQGYDSEAGVKTVCVKESLVKNDLGQEVESESTYSYYDTNNLESSLSEDSHSYLYTVNHEFTTEENGLVHLEISLMDYAGNCSSEKSFDVLYQNSDMVLYIGSNTLEVAEKNADSGEYLAPVSFGQNGFGIYRSACYKNFYSDFRLTLKIQEEGKEERTLFENQNPAGEKGFLILIDSLLNEGLGNYKRNSSLRTFLTFILQNDSGYSTKTVLEVPKSPVISFIDPDTFTETIEERDYLPQCSFFNVENVYQFTYQENTESQKLGPYVFENFSDFSSCPNGIYTIYSYRKIDYVDTSGFPEEIKEQYSCSMISAVEDPYIFYNGIEHPQSDSVNFPTFTLPAQEEILFEKNSGKAKFNVEVNFPQNEYTYAIKFSFTNAEDKEESAGLFYLNPIEVQSGVNMSVSLIAFDSSGNFVNESTPQTLDLRGTDNIPPTITGISSSDNAIYRVPNYVSYTFTPCDWNAQTENYSFNIESVDYYILPAYSSPSLEEAKSSALRKGSLTCQGGFAEAGMINIPFDGLDVDYYEVWLYFEDNSPMKNYYWGCPTSGVNKSEPFMHYVSPKIPSVEKNGESLRIKTPVFTKDCNPQGHTLRTDGNENPGVKTYTGIQYVQAGEWTSLEFSDGSFEKEITLISSGGKNSYLDLNLVSENINPGKFTKVWAKYTYTNTTFSTWNWNMPLKSIIIYPDYIKKLGTAEEIICWSKNVIPGSNGIQIYCDQPVFVHTMYCTKKLSETNSTEDAVEWEAEGQECGMTVYQPDAATSYTYLKRNYDSIPEGAWYTTIVHFADGDIVMGEVFQK